MPTETSFAAVLFDCDGVLVDSESIATRALHKSLQSVGVTLTEHEVAQQFTGHAWPRCIEMIEELIGQTLPDTFLADNRTYFESLMADALLPMPGVVELLDRLALPFAVVTNSRTQELAFKLGVSGLDRYFSGAQRFDAEAMGVAKPDPAIYRRSAERLGFDIKQCLIIEDSYPGLVAATESGATVWAYRPSATAEQLAQLSVTNVMTDWREFPQLPER
ncbi:HAD family phosphatase [Salinispirillum sp. LH 10-3-1]|uniref:HAD family phosphatase n=1 Tax=Salinispirillum sp. LH 10-3-1 TaxID=2952525 RepID=A0AB38YG08_9GAMM